MSVHPMVAIVLLLAATISYAIKHRRGISVRVDGKRLVVDVDSKAKRLRRTMNQDRRWRV